MKPTFRRRLIQSIALLMLLLSGSATAACNITITIPSALTSSDAVSWAACGSSGTTIQSALNHVAGQGGGSVKLTGPGSVLVRSPLVVGYATTLYGDSAVTYGMTLIGESNPPGCTYSSDGYRHFGCPIVRVSNLTANPPAGLHNATIWNLKFDGTTSGRPLTAPAVSIGNSKKVLVTNTYATGVRYMAYEVGNSPDTDLVHVSADLTKGTGAFVDTVSGAGIWIFRSNGTLVDSAQVFAIGHYNAGYPSSTNPTRDLVLVSGSSNVDIVGSLLKYTNTAGVYVTCDPTPTSDCPGSPANPRSSNITVWDNDIQYTRQHGIDIAYTDNADVLTNRIYDVGHAGIALAGVTGGDTRFNTIKRSGKETVKLPTQSYGALLILEGTNNLTVSDNHFYGSTPAGQTRYSVFFQPWSGTPAQTGNQVINNQLWAGTSGYIGGASAGNTISPNTLN